MGQGHGRTPAKKPSPKLGLIGAGLLVKSLVDFYKNGLGTNVIAVVALCLGLGLLAVYAARAFKARSQVKDLERFEDLYRLIDEDVPYAAGAFPDRTVEVLEVQGPAGSNALARLILELLESRSAGLVLALAVARRIRPTPALLRAVDAVLAAGPHRPGEPGRFSPESQEPGQVGWNHETASRIGVAARETQFALQSRIYSHPDAS